MVEAKVDGTKFARLLTTALQVAAANNWTVEINDNGQLVFNKSPQPVIIVGHMDSAGLVKPGDALGQMPFTDAAQAVDITAILAAINKSVDRVETVTESVVLTDAGGGSTDILVAAPAAGFHLVITGLRLLGVNLAVLSVSFDTVPASVLKGDRIAAGRASSIINAPLPTATALTSTMTGGGNAVTYTIEVTHATEAD